MTSQELDTLLSILREESVKNSSAKAMEVMALFEIALQLAKMNEARHDTR